MKWQIWSNALRLTIIAIIIGISVIGCATPSSQGVSYEEYNRINNQLRDTQAQVSQLENEISELKKQVETLDAENTRLLTEISLLKIPSPIPTATPPPATPTNGTHSINEVVVVSNMAKWEVLTVRNRGSILYGSESRYPMFSEDKTTVGKFIEVTFVVENIGSTSVNWVDEPKLIDNKGREFSPAESYYE